MCTLNFKFVHIFNRTSTFSRSLRAIPLIGNTILHVRTTYTRNLRQSLQLCTHFRYKHHQSSTISNKLFNNKLIQRMPAQIQTFYSTLSLSGSLSFVLRVFLWKKSCIFILFKNLVVKDITMYWPRHMFAMHTNRREKMKRSKLIPILCVCSSRNKKLLDSRLTVFKLVRRKSLIALALACHNTMAIVLKMYNMHRTQMCGVQRTTKKEQQKHI